MTTDENNRLVVDGEEYWLLKEMIDEHRKNKLLKKKGSKPGRKG